MYRLLGHVSIVGGCSKHMQREDDEDEGKGNVWVRVRKKMPMCQPQGTHAACARACGVCCCVPPLMPGGLKRRGLQNPRGRQRCQGEVQT